MVPSVYLRLTPPELLVHDEPAQVLVVGDFDDNGADILTPAALAFVGAMVRRFGAPLQQLLADRAERRTRIAAGARLDFLAETADIRAGTWGVAPAPADLERRVVEIHAPAERHALAAALGSGADVVVADLEDAVTPTWDNVIAGQRILRDAVRGTLADDGGAPPALVVRPRGLHLPERHLLVDGRIPPAALVDAALFVFHNARALMARGSAPYLYLAKLESHVEAAWWAEVLSAFEDELGLPRSTVRVSVLIETLPATFEMDEILHALRDRVTALNCGRWDFIFSAIKVRRDDASALLPDRAQVTIHQPVLRAFTQLAVRTCHRRGVHAIGGMSNQVPEADDLDAAKRAHAEVADEKRREAADGFDGAWVADPAMVATARDAFDALLCGAPHQRHVLRQDVRVTPADLMRTPQGTRTEAGLRHNIRVGITYIEGWLRGRGHVAIDGLLEDASTVEIARTQVWQWVHHRARLTDGRAVTQQLVERLADEELTRLLALPGAADRGRRFGQARDLFVQVATGEPLAEFLTSEAYRLLT